ncbi:MAG: M3 family peptidase, partial [Cytophagales bacterium]|nr:M3 family peptidase [Cytophagales bacterium]
MSNPLLKEFDTPFGTVPFELIHPHHFLPALEEAIQNAKQEIQAIIKTQEAPSFENTVEMLEHSGKLVGQISSVFFNLNAAETSKEIQKIAQQFSPVLTEYTNDILLNEKLFRRIEQVYNSKEQLRLNPEQNTLLEKTYKSFVRNGAKLADEKKEELRAIDKELAQKSLKFGENVLQETNSYELTITNVDDLDGLPDFVCEAAGEEARKRGKEDQWVFTLEYPSYIPFVTYADNRELRKQITIAAGQKAFKNNEYNNESLITDI